MIKSAFKDIARGKLSSLITICGISVSVAAVVIISLISFTGKDMISSELANLGVSGIMILPADENNTQSLGTAQLEQIKQFECVSSAMPVLAKYIDITVKNQTNTCVVWGVDSGQKQVFDLNLLHGRLLSDDDIKKENKVCIVDETYAVGLYKRTNIVGKEIKISLNGAEENFQVVGVVSSGGVITQGILKNFTPYFVYLPFTTMQTIGGYEGFSQVAVKLKNDILPAQGETILNNQLKQTFKNQGEYYTQNMAEKKSAIDSSLDTVAIILALIAAISLIVSGLTVMI
ncbi:MAG: ABC transporter permease, partial [Oscillospiraceae bacterium]